MENIRDTVTIVNLLEVLTLQIPYLANHMFFDSADENNESAVIKLAMFQNVEF